MEYQETNNYHWWTLEESEIYKSVKSFINFIDQDQSYRQNENFKNMRLYGNYDLFNLRAYNYVRTEPSTSIQNRVTLNIVQSMIDTVVSKITKNKPRPLFLTDGGDFTQSRRAEKLSQFVEGQFQACDFYAKAAIAFLDACIFGTGCLKIFRGGKDNNEIKVERTFIDEIVIDDKEAFYGQPRQMHQRKQIHKDVLKHMFPDSASIIEASTTDTTVYNQSNGTSRDMIQVTESWHLPSGEGATDGKHSIVINNHTLFSEDYNKSYFPFVFFRWALRPLGFFGQGISEQLAGLQLEINKILRTIQVSMHLVSIPKIFVEASSKVVSAHLDNKIGGIIKYAGTPPTEGKLGSIPTELFNHLDRLYGRAYEIVGVSQLSATSAKPVGLNSGKALREYNDLETERFMSVAQRYEKAFLDAAEIMVDLAADIAEDTGNYSVKVRGSEFMKTIKWSEVRMDQDDYTMGLFPTSSLSQNPAGRMEDVQELISAGFIGKEDGMKLLNFPDLKAYYNLSTAAGYDIDRLIEKFIDDGQYETPEPYQNLEYGKTKMQQAYLYYRSKGAPEERLELFRRWIEDAQGLVNKATVAAQTLQAETQMNQEKAAQEQAAQSQDMVPPEEMAAQEAAIAGELPPA